MADLSSALTTHEYIYALFKAEKKLAFRPKIRYFEIKRDAEAPVPYSEHKAYRFGTRRLGQLIKHRPVHHSDSSGIDDSLLAFF